MAQKAFEIKYYLVFQRKSLFQNILSNTSTKTNVSMYLAEAIRKRHIWNLSKRKYRAYIHWYWFLWNLLTKQWDTETPYFLHLTLYLGYIDNMRFHATKECYVSRNYTDLNQFCSQTYLSRPLVTKILFYNEYENILIYIDFYQIVYGYGCLACFSCILCWIGIKCWYIQ